MILDRIAPLSLAKILGVLYAAIGLVLGLLYGGFFLLVGVGSLASGEEAGLAAASGMGALGLFAVFMAPIFYGALGFVGGLLTAWLYNVSAGWMGGLELELRPRS